MLEMLVRVVLLDICLDIEFVIQLGLYMQHIFPCNSLLDLSKSSRHRSKESKLGLPFGSNDQHFDKISAKDGGHSGGIEGCPRN